MSVGIGLVALSNAIIEILLIIFAYKNYKSNYRNIFLTVMLVINSVVFGITLFMAFYWILSPLYSDITDKTMDTDTRGLTIIGMFIMNIGATIVALVSSGVSIVTAVISICALATNKNSKKSKAINNLAKQTQ